ncbi:MAG: fimbrillin family protein [Bacteroidaceae bacterium]|nr:fimbrillin family protein [Bacteroidaceae bacterium]
MKKHIFTILPMVLFASCTSELADMNVNNVTEGNVDKVTIKSKPFVYDDDTRTSLTATDNGISFAWADYDALGVFPITPQSNNQAKQPLNINPASCENDAHYATFDGAGWALKKGNTYAAYSPYNGDIPSSTPYTSVPIDMTGQDGTLATIGRKYDYMYAPSTFTEEKCSDGTSHEVVFDFNHAVSIIQLRLTIPVATTWKDLTLSSATGHNVWMTKATMDVSNGEITPTDSSSNISVSLSNVTTTVESQEIIVYVAALPTETGVMYLSATATDGREYCAALSSKELVAGKAYRWIATLAEFYTGDGTQNGHNYADLGLNNKVKWAMTNIGATNPEDYGGYYSWGETMSYGEADQKNLTNFSYNDQQSYVKTIYHWKTYKWCDGTYNTMTKYCTDSEYGNYDDKKYLEEEDDAAVQKWGSGWHIPNVYEMNDLCNKCYCVWTNNYHNTNTSGYILYKAKSSSDMGQVVALGDTPSSNYSLSDTHIFLPAAGCYCSRNGLKTNEGTFCYYWSSSLCTAYTETGWGRCLNTQTSSPQSIMRYYGCSIRAVIK